MKVKAERERAEQLTQEQLAEQLAGLSAEQITAVIASAARNPQVRARDLQAIAKQCTNIRATKRECYIETRHGSGKLEGNSWKVITSVLGLDHWQVRAFSFRMILATIGTNPEALSELVPDAELREALKAYAERRAERIAKQSFDKLSAAALWLVGAEQSETESEAEQSAEQSAAESESESESEAAESGEQLSDAELAKELGE